MVVRVEGFDVGNGVLGGAPGGAVDERGEFAGNAFLARVFLVGHPDFEEAFGARVLDKLAGFLVFGDGDACGHKGVDVYEVAPVLPLANTAAVHVCFAERVVGANEVFRLGVFFGHVFVYPEQAFVDVFADVVKRAEGCFGVGAFEDFDKGLHDAF